MNYARQLYNLANNIPYKLAIEKVIKVTKKKLREHMLERRNQLSLSDVQEKSFKINQQLFLLDTYYSAKIILTYLPIKKEPNSLLIIKNAWQQKKQVLVPLTCPTNKTLLLSRLESLEELTEGYYSIPEPKQEFFRPADPLSVDICLLPGVAFDHSGYRLGYGGGYFDRFLPSLQPDCLKIALAYDFQVLDTLPRTKYDLPVDIIITETTTYIFDTPLK